MRITSQPALAPSPQPRPAPTAQALPPKHVAQGGPYCTPIGGPDPMPIDSKSAAKPLRQRSSFQSNPLEVVGGVPQNRQKAFGFARDLHFPNDLACVIHNADAGLLDRYVQSSKMVHAALLLLMLEAVHTDLVFTISLKRSTQNLPLSTNSPADYPIFGSCVDG